MKRLIYRELIKWKASNDRKPLILLGARQIGKTWIMKEFGHNEYKNVAYINCDNDNRFSQILADDYDIGRILLGIQAITGVKITPEDTLIIIDEIQQATRGLHSLKYFCENAPQYHVMVAGSMLGVTLAKNESFPVGKVDILHMYPMTFKEFLMAKGLDQIVEIMDSLDWTAIDIISSKLIENLRQYYFIGGMPEVVADYVNHNDLSKVRQLQTNILEAYRRDISKHSSPKESIRIGQVLNSLPSQLTKENKKFIYGAIKKGARANDFELAIQWLIDAGLVYKVTRVTKPQIPMKFYEDINCFKLFFLDCGLFGCLTQAPPSQILIANNVFVEFKGAFAEQFVMQEISAEGISPYYWSKENSPAEIDFLIQIDNRAIPIEVKAEENVKSRSLSQFTKDNNLKGVRFSLKGYADQGWMENIPLYCIAPFINSLKSQTTTTII